MPSIQRLYEKSKDTEFYLLTYESVDKIKEFMVKHNFTFPVYSYQDKNNLPEYFQQINDGGIPDTYIIYDNKIEFN